MILHIYWDAQCAHPPTPYEILMKCFNSSPHNFKFIVCDEISASEGTWQTYLRQDVVGKSSLSNQLDFSWFSWVNPDTYHQMDFDSNLIPHHYHCSTPQLNGLGKMLKPLIWMFLLLKMGLLSAFLCVSKNKYIEVPQGLEYNRWSWNTIKLLSKGL